MKKIVVTLFSLGMFFFGYTQGINFQGVARSANGTIIAGSNVSLRLSIISKNVDATPEYVETKTVMTNAQGIFSIVVGDGSNTAVVGNFKNIVWSDNPKFLKVEMDPAGGTNYLNMGATQLQYVPYSFYSYGVDASNVKGIVPVKAGGTGVATLEELKTALNIVIPPSIDTNSLSNRINGKLSSIDTASLSNRINSKLSTSDFTSKDLADIRENIVIGPYALINNKTGYGNIALGKNSLNFLDSGSNNIAIGANTLTKMVIGGGGQGSENLAIGSSALQFSTGNGNTAVGTQTLQNSTRSYWNVAVGQHVMRSLLTGSNNVGIGYAAMINSSGSASNNTIVGHDAGHEIVGNNNTAIGESSLRQNTTGSQNTSVGNRALLNNLTGSSNVAIGNYALYNNKTGSDNTAVGSNALINDTSKGENTAVGSFALANNKSGIYNTAVGRRALENNLTGRDNTAVGLLSQWGTTTGGENTSFASRSLENNTTGYRNNAFGVYSIFSNMSGFDNAAFGTYSLRYNTTGNSNSAFGNGALNTNITGSFNTAIGYNADVASGNFSNTTAIGNGAVVSASNTIQLGNSEVTEVKTSGIISSGKGFLPSGLTVAERNAIVNPARGLIIFCSNCGADGELQTYNGSIWKSISLGAASDGPSSTVQSGLVAYFPFNGNVIDLSASNLSAINTNATLTTDRNGNPNSAYYFNGTNAKIEVNTFDKILGNNPFTVSFWIAPEVSTGWILSFGQSTNGKAFECGTHTLGSGNFTAEIWKYDYSNFPSIALTMNTYQFLTVTYDGSVMKVYKNGVLSNTKSIDYIATDILSGILSIGKQIDFQEYFKGKLDDIRIHKRTLSQEEITYLANN
jgi:hypothetical protein